jgi:hypothetical protein
LLLTHPVILGLFRRLLLRGCLRAAASSTHARTRHRGAGRSLCLGTGSSDFFVSVLAATRVDAIELSVRSILTPAHLRVALVGRVLFLDAAAAAAAATSSLCRRSGRRCLRRVVGVSSALAALVRVPSAAPAAIHTIEFGTAPESVLAQLVDVDDRGS